MRHTKHEDIGSEKNYILKTKQDKIYGCEKKNDVCKHPTPNQNRDEASTKEQT